MKNITWIAIFGLIIFALFSFKYSATFNQLVIGDKLPEFKLKNQANEAISIKDYIGKKNLVIYFYPKDDTPGCTKEACKFRDEFEVFIELDALVIGISADSPESHLKFKEKYNLPFILLSDKHDEVRKLFGVDGFYNERSPGRVTFVVDKKGVIQFVFNSETDVEEHIISAQMVLQQI